MKKKFFTLGLLAMILMAFAGQVTAQCCVAPTNLRVKSIGKREADLKWTRVKQTGCTTPVKYKVQYRVAGTTTWNTIMVRTMPDDVTGDTTAKGLLPGITYQWRVQGICSATSKTAFINGPNFTTLALAVVATNGLSSQDKLAVTASPNPVVNQLKLTGHIQIEGPVDIQIVNQTGFTVFHQSFNFNSYDFNTSIDFSRFQKGIYIVAVSAKTERVTLNIIKE
jgi:hypothetical protein